MAENGIDIRLTRDEQKIPLSISWTVFEEGRESIHQAKAMLLAFWDGADKSALRLDLWTKDMMVDEMADFFYQTLMTMADTFNQATQSPVLAREMKSFARDFLKRYRDKEKETQAI
ncbi:MAG TPA: hypothetical protein VNE41_07480 [Chitinophagaceae bacterium]|nr:hypothetical protein [Chitinophagaceae bacterium]